MRRDASAFVQNGDTPPHQIVPCHQQRVVLRVFYQPSSRRDRLPRETGQLFPIRCNRATGRVSNVGHGEEFEGSEGSAAASFAPC